MHDFEYYMEQFENGSMEVPTIGELLEAARCISETIELTGLNAWGELSKLCEQAYELDSILKATRLYRLNHGCITEDLLDH